MTAASAVSLTWLVVRASGWVAYMLVTASVSLGILVSRRWNSATWNRLAISDAHGWLATLLYVFIGVHTLAVLLDPFTKFTAWDVVVPFYSSYRPLWLTLGIVAGELAIAVGVTVWLRSLLGYPVWRRLHTATYGVFFLSLLHGLGAGSDTQTVWGTLAYISSGLLVVGLTLWRLSESPVWQNRLLWVALGGTLTITVWAAFGPYAPGWAAVAGTPAALIGGHS